MEGDQVTTAPRDLPRTCVRPSSALCLPPEGQDRSDTETIVIHKEEQCDVEQCCAEHSAFENNTVGSGSEAESQLSSEQSSTTHENEGVSGTTELGSKLCAVREIERKSDVTAFRFTVADLEAALSQVELDAAGHQVVVPNASSVASKMPQGSGGGRSETENRQYLACRSIVQEILSYRCLTPEAPTVQVFTVTTGGPGPSDTAPQQQQQHATPPPESPDLNAQLQIDIPEVAPPNGAAPVSDNGGGGDSRDKPSVNGDVERKDKKREHETEEERRLRKLHKEKKKKKKKEEREREKSSSEKKDKETSADKHEKSKHKDKDRDKDREKKHKDEERDKVKKKVKPVRLNLEQIGEILNKRQGKVKVIKAPSPVPDGEMPNGESVATLDLGGGFYLEDAKLYVDKETAKVVARAPKPRDPLDIKIIESEDKDKPTVEEIKKESEDKVKETKEPQDAVKCKEEPKGTQVKMEVDEKSESTVVKSEEAVTVKEENVANDTGAAKEENNEGSEEKPAEVKAENAAKESEKKGKKGHKIKMKSGEIIKSPVRAGALLKKFKVSISRKERKRANRAGKKGSIEYTEDIKADVKSKKTKYSARHPSDEPPKEPEVVKKPKAEKRERKAMILDSSDESSDDEPKPKKRAIMEDADFQPKRERDDSRERKPKMPDSMPLAQTNQDMFEMQIAEKHRLMRLQKEQQLKDGGVDIAQFNQAAMSNRKLKNMKMFGDATSRVLFRQHAKWFGLKMTSVDISYKERRRAEKHLKRIKGTLYYFELKRMRSMRYEKLEKRGVEFKGTSGGPSQPAKRHKPGPKSKTFGGFKIPKQEEGRKEAVEEEPADEEGFFTEAELKAMEGGDEARRKAKEAAEAKKREKEEQLEKLRAEWKEKRKWWKHNVRDKAGGTIRFEVTTESVAWTRLFSCCCPLTSVLHPHEQ